jgi:hypothetical protein
MHKQSFFLLVLIALLTWTESTFAFGEICNQNFPSKKIRAGTIEYPGDNWNNRDGSVDQITYADMTTFQSRYGTIGKPATFFTQELVNAGYKIPGNFV